MSLTTLEVKAFQAIQDFCKGLVEIFPKRQHSLELYTRLVSNTSLDKEEFIRKHLNLFTEFCRENRQALLNKDLLNLASYQIIYNKERNIFINLKYLIDIASKDNKEAIDLMLSHILAINVLLNPTKENKEVYTSFVNDSKEDDTKEQKGDENIMDELLAMIAPSIDVNNPNPMSAISDTVKSGGLQKVIGRIIQGYQDKTLTMDTLLGSAKKTFTKAGVDEKQFSSILSSVSNVANSIDSNPDMVKDLLNGGSMESLINNNPELKDLMSKGNL